MTADKMMQLKNMKEQSQESESLTKKPSKGSKVEYFQYGNFNIPIFKFPFESILTIFLPLWMLGIINLGIFFLESDLSVRVASITTLMIAFTALVAAIRQQIPPSPGVILVQVLVYAQAATSLLALIQSLTIRKQTQWKMNWSQNWQFILSCIITGLSVLVIFVLMGVHYGFWNRHYQKRAKSERQKTSQVLYNPNKDNIQGSKKPSFLKDQWFNSACDELFNKKFDFYKQEVQAVDKKEKDEQNPKKPFYNYFILKAKQTRQNINLNQKYIKNNRKQ